MEQEIKKFLRLQIFGAFPENRATCLGPLILDQFWICALLLFCFFEMKKKTKKKHQTLKYCHTLMRISICFAKILLWFVSITL